MKNIYQSTNSFLIATEIKGILNDLDKAPTFRSDLNNVLLVPDTLIIQKAPINGTIETEKGNIDFQLIPDLAPLTVSNFINLAKKGFYNNLTFHRVVPDFVVQGGDPRGDGWGGPQYAIPCEYNTKPFERGTIGMATAGKDTGSSQFFICHSEQPHLNRRYTVFGQVVKGMEIVDNLEIDDKILKITFN
jgi:cyclophilin family peptidyl-prolyl cis-trans isomerase